MPEDKIIIHLVRGGNADAFRDIVEHYQQPVIRYLYRLTGNYELARDLCQDTFVQAYRNIMATDTDLQLKPWLYRIATNNFRQYYRRRKIVQFVPFVSGNHDKARNDFHRDSPEETVAVAEALLKVPKSRRTCLVLHLVEGLTYREIGEALGCTEEAVRKRVSRGKLEFRKFYGEGGVG